MTTLAEIETAVERLSPEEQRALLDHLQNVVRGHKGDTSAARAEWLRQLREFRNSSGAGGEGLSSEAILEDLRED